MNLIQEVGQMIPVSGDFFSFLHDPEKRLKPRERETLFQMITHLNLHFYFLCLVSRMASLLSKVSEWNLEFADYAVEIELAQRTRVPV